MKRILLATDGSGHALKASQYLANLYKGTRDVEIDILHISPPVPPLYREGQHDPQVRKGSDAWKKRTEQEAKRYLEEAAGILERGGIGRNQIKTKQAHQVAGVARDILRETSAGQYDACAIGKKGTGWFDDVFLGSITNKLLEVSENHPLWLVSGDEWISPKVFIVMDHTPQAVQLATHVGNMLRGLEGVHVSFYHYCSPFTETLPPEEREKMNDVEKRMVEKDRDQMQHFFEEALRVLEDSGFHRQTVGSEFEQGESGSPKKVSQRILQKVRDGNYGTLVIGRKGATGAREFRLGSVAWRIATEAENCAVWVVPAR